MYFSILYNLLTFVHSLTYIMYHIMNMQNISLGYLIIIININNRFCIVIIQYCMRIRLCFVVVSRLTRLNLGRVLRTRKNVCSFFFKQMIRYENLRKSKYFQIYHANRDGGFGRRFITRNSRFSIILSKTT